ncbi:MAG: TlpA disulfide reductase family protein [Wenzhouxiangellaceae bacterium]|nr:TlpA disulfide reductase family protein [Wenzhouxiangellaceae bacterium]
MNSLRTLLALCLVASAALAEESIETSAAAPIELSLPDLEGRERSLSEWRGDWVVVNYWATWCAPCRKEIPDFSNLHDARDDVTVLGLAFEDTDVETFRAFLEDYPASYPILRVDVYDPPASLGAPRALPTTYLVDPEGRLAETWIGPITSDVITRRIDGERVGDRKSSAGDGTLEE